MQFAREQIEQALSGDPEVWRNFATSIGLFATNLVLAALILAVTLWASGWAARLVKRTIDRLPGRRTNDTTLQSFASSLTRWIVIIVGAIAVLQQLGVQTTSILAVLGAASLAVGLALQGALSNVAAGVMILILRPYRVGDVVEINGHSGTVRALDLFGTLLSDADNLDVFVPNSRVFGEVIINYSTPGERRMELKFQIDYADDLDRALEVLLACAKADPRILETPAPSVQVTALGDYAVTVALRAWAPVASYWEARYAMLKQAKEDLAGGGFSVAYPHQVTVEKPAPSPSPRR